MKATIKEITLQNFKGCKNATYTFDGKNATVCGCNGIGKTTIATAYYWVFADKDTELKSNPSVRRIGEEESTPSVIIDMDIDGTGVTVEKFQKRSEKEVSENGKTVTKVSLENCYKVNGVPMGLQKFKQKMATYGFDMEKFLQLSHIDVFTNQMSTGKESEKMRETLFEMTDSFTDSQIAEMLGNMPDLVEMFREHTKEEIVATQNDILRNIKKEYGNKGEVLNAQIEGIEHSIDVVEKGISDIDVAELELQRNALIEQIAENKAKQDDISKQFEEYQKLSDGIMELKFAESDLHRKANEENIKARREIDDKISDKKFLVKQTEKTIDDCESQIDISKHHSVVLNESLESYRSQYKDAQNLEFDENSLVCSYCGQEYPQDRKEQIKAEFDRNKATEIKKITELGNKAKVELDKEKGTIDSLEKELVEHRESLKMLNTAIADLEKQLSELPTSIDISDTEEYKAIQSQIAEKEQAMSQMNNASSIRESLEAEAEDLHIEYTETEKKISSIENAMKSIESLEKEIADLRNKQSEYEQNKANAEKILYQLDLVSKRKNELLTDDINKHFDIVRWQMFEYQKNGEIKDCCIPLIDGKRFGESTNKGREILAKLDIIKGLQKFYGQFYPVFLDNAESLSEETLKRIDMHCQLIFLSVPRLSSLQRRTMTSEQIKEFEEYYKELKVEVV